MGHPRLLAFIVFNGDSRLSCSLVKFPPDVRPEFFEHDGHGVVSVLTCPDFGCIVEGPVGGNVTQYSRRGGSDQLSLGMITVVEIAAAIAPPTTSEKLN